MMSPAWRPTGRTVRLWDARHARRGDFETTPPITRPSGARVGLRAAIRARPVRIGEGEARAHHRLAEIAAPGTTDSHRPAETILRPLLALDGIVSDHLAQFGLRAAPARPIAARQHRGIPDAVRARRSLAGEFAGRRARWCRRRQREPKRHADACRQEAPPGSLRMRCEGRFFHGAPIVSQCEGPRWRQLRHTNRKLRQSRDSQRDADAFEASRPPASAAVNA